MQRRNLLRAAGGIGAAGVAGGAGLLAMSGNVAAASFTFNAGDIEGEFEDGDVSRVYFSPEGTASWKNFDEEITAIGLEIRSRVRSADGESTLDGWKQVYTGTATAEEHGLNSGTTGGHSGDIGPNPNTLYEGAETDPFDEPDDGSTNQTLIDLELTAELLNSNGELADPSDKAVLSDTATFVVTAENLEASASGSADANPDME